MEKETVIDLEMLKQARGARSLQNVGEAIGVTRQMVSLYESGANEPPVSTLVKLANLYGIKVGKLIIQKKPARKKVSETVK